MWAHAYKHYQSVFSNEERYHQPKRPSYQTRKQR